ncbi:hypothetical protein GN316_06625 [Xylophilus sp. Kf1]|nr:hypothetical protein [Xylophilus sp. Kf1]
MQDTPSNFDEEIELDSRQQRAEEGRQDQAAIKKAAETAAEYFEEIKNRCKAAGMNLEPIRKQGDSYVRIGFKSGRETRNMNYWPKSYKTLCEIDFDKYCIIAGYGAIFNPSTKTIEASIRPIAADAPMSAVIRKIFNLPATAKEGAISDVKVILNPVASGLPTVELSILSPAYSAVFQAAPTRLSLKIFNHQETSHEGVKSLLEKIAGSVLFQLDQLTGVAFHLDRYVGKSAVVPATKVGKFASDLQFPAYEYEAAPLSLFNYARSADGMPLLQFLAFYQAIEYFFPAYAYTEALQRIKGILKNPTFRSDNDSDLSQILATIQVNRSGGFGDERSQLKATLTHCLDPDRLRIFLDSDNERKKFFTKPTKEAYHRLAIPDGKSPDPRPDLRPDVAERIYEIRCKIVHTKADARDSNVELLLPFTKAADELSADISLVAFVAKEVISFSGRTFNAHQASK